MQPVKTPPQTTSLPVLKDSLPQSSSPMTGHHEAVSQIPIENQSSSHEPTPQTVSTQNKKPPRYTYVPYYETTPSYVSSQVRTQNIIEGTKCQRRPLDQLMLADVVTYKQALSDPLEEEAWKSAMKQEYDSLMNHSTGELVPYPSDGTKLIGGMWWLTQKRDKFGKVYRHKACWVVLGNHQEHLIYHFDTWAFVGQNETFKIMLILGVRGFELPGKEGWVWRLNKSLYGTKKAPRMWQDKLVEVLDSLGMRPTRADDLLYSNKN
ncbi:hypothetical protein O181_013037 [Austropuccinia psidii MF-1]|uniref:Reverse transcriptase Ty1/copia-type domain-containing protein n=1 Tax=Austropuccinia psidii MF-1 TaxID=1389203 RepID=A0A9Q3GNK0_9BASI|nr:hypothetical protein [Austropuccinia psidii MF-1]